ncbi:MAG: hypothetical protein H6R25_911 [Proteobacteria bacterium]|nr:hypothetical protein [Pseudomonadota bacterium]
MKIDITDFIRNQAAKLIIVSFSPTGGGHTARLLNIIEMALNKGAISKGSVVLFHLPCRWEGNPRSALISTLATKLTNKYIKVLMAESDKSIYGYLKKETGGSDDASILQRVARFPLRDGAQNKGHVVTLHDFIVFSKKEDCENLPVISAKKLMDSVAEIFGDNVLKERCYVITDMDPYLQKAAIRKGVSEVRCLDQQNHGIMLDLNSIDLNLLPKYALLSKVLGGYGEKISHIDLGGRNSLESLVPLANQLNIDGNTSKRQARDIVAKLLIRYALNDSEIDVKLAAKEKSFSGVIRGTQVSAGNPISNIFYIYAHKKTNLIAECVVQQIRENTPAFQNAIFLFCGADAVGKYNAMHLAYIADADGITTAGAGTVGEFAYLRKHAQCGSRLLILPIEGHNEQEKNADVLSQSRAIKNFIVRTLEKEPLSAAIQRFVNGQPKTVDAPVSMSEFINAISDPNTYVQQAYDLLFTDTFRIDFNNILDVERAMNKNPLLRATRKYLKLVFQALDVTDELTDRKSAIKILLKQGESIVFAGVNDLDRKLNNPLSLKSIIGLKDVRDVNQLPLLRDVQNHFSALARGSRLSSARLKEEFGEFMVTGF